MNTEPPPKTHATAAGDASYVLADQRNEQRMPNVWMTRVWVP